MTDHIQLCQTLWVCSFLPGSCKSLQICGWWQARRSHGSSSRKTYISQCRSPRVTSQELLTSQNYNSPNWHYSDQWKLSTSQPCFLLCWLLMERWRSLFLSAVPAQTPLLLPCGIRWASSRMRLWGFLVPSSCLSSHLPILSYWGKPCVQL